jgi:hypothetical protein
MKGLSMIEKVSNVLFAATEIFTSQLKADY